MRLQKYIAKCGVASRRKSELIIKAGRVRINNKIVKKMGVKIDPYKDKVSVDNKRITPEKKVYLVFNKPPGVISTVSDPENRQTVMDFVPYLQQRVFPVGRLDYNSEGLLIMTNDGDLTNKLLHPSRKVEKVYKVKIKGRITHEDLKKIRQGVVIDDGTKAKADISVADILPKNTWLKLVIHEGRNRIIRRIMEALDYEIIQLMRIGFGSLKLKGLEKGKYRTLNYYEVENLINSTKQ
ncbi:MAG: pseudouridine synthase [Myxococcota bacterium]